MSMTELERRCVDAALKYIDNEYHAYSIVRAVLAEAGVDELRQNVIAFAAPWAAQYAADHGFPKGHLHPTHYDILEKAGARMVDFTRAKIGANQ